MVGSEKYVWPTGRQKGGPWAPQTGVNPMINVVLLLVLWDGKELGTSGPY